MSSSSEDSSSDSDTQSPDDRTVSDSDPGSAYLGHSQSDADARDSDWETEDENREDMSDTEFHTPGESEESSLFSRYSGRCDEVQPTIKLSDFVIKLAHDVLTKGKFRNTKDWDRIVRKYLTLPTSQYEKLSQDIQLEDLFDQFKYDKRYKNLFKYHKEARSALKDLRIAQRPVLAVIQRLNRELIHLRDIGEDCGLKFPAKAPARSGKSVPRDGRKVLDKLKIESTEELFSVPDIADFAARHGYVATQELQEMFVNYREDIINKFTYLYTSVSDAFTNIDDYMIFYLDLYSHCDAAFRELLRERLATIFKAPIKAEILKKSSAKKLKDKPKGLYGGEDGIRSNLKNATKKESYINKAVVKRTYNKDRSSREDRSPESRFSKKPQRSRSRSPARDKSDNRDKKHGFYNNGGKGKGKPGKGYSKNYKGKDSTSKKD